MAQQFPSKYVVCPDCQGEGTHGPGFVYTAQDVDEQFESREEFAEHIAQIRAGQFDQPCDWCKGKRVVPVRSNGQSAEDAWREECEYRAEVAAERRMGA